MAAPIIAQKRGAVPTAPVNPYAPNQPDAAGQVPATDPNLPIEASPTQPSNPKVIETTLDPNAPVPGTAYQTGSYATPGYIPPAYTGSGLAGFDPTKLNNPLYLDPKYEWARIASSSPDPQTALSKLVQAYPGTVINGDTATIPGVGTIDLYGDFGGANNIQWLDKGYEAQQNAVQAAALNQLTGGSGIQVAPINTGGSSVTTGASQPNGDALNAAILKLLQTPTDLSAADLQSSPEAQAFNLTRERKLGQDQAQAAESAAYQGTSNQGGVTRGLAQQAAEDEAGFVGSLANTKLQQNRDLLVQGIQIAEQAGQFEQAQALQSQLAQLDASIRQQSLAEQARESNNNLGFNYASLGANLDNASVIALLNALGG